MTFVNPPLNTDASSFQKTERKAVIVLAGIFSLRMLAVFMLLPIFAVFAKTLTGSTPIKVGLALGIYGLMQACLQAPFGYISDRFGRKPVIALGLTLFAIGSIVAAMSHSITGVIWGRSLQGTGAIGSVIMAWLTDLTREQVRFKAMAVVGISIGASFGLAFILGPLFNSWVGVTGIFWLMSIFSLCAIVLIYWGLPTSLPLLQPSIGSRHSSASIGISASILSVLQPHLLPLYFGVLVIHASLIALFLKLPIAVSNLMSPEAQALQFYLPIFLASAITTFPCLRWIEKVNRTIPVLLSCSALLGLSIFIMYFYLSSWLGLGLGLYLFFTIFNILEASLPTYLSKAVKSSYKGTALGVFSSLQFLGLCIGGVFGGWLDGHMGTLAVFAFCVILTLIWSVWLGVLNSLHGLNSKLNS